MFQSSLSSSSSGGNGGGNSKNVISDVPIYVQVVKEGIPDVTLVDLPGINYANEVIKSKCTVNTTALLIWLKCLWTSYNMKSSCVVLEISCFKMLERSYEMRRTHQIPIRRLDVMPKLIVFCFRQHQESLWEVYFTRQCDHPECHIGSHRHPRQRIGSIRTQGKYSHIPSLVSPNFKHNPVYYPNFSLNSQVMI